MSEGEAARTETTRAEAARTEAAQPEQRPRLLLVEDEPALRVLLARVLDRAGYEVADAPSGEEALERFTEAPERFAAAVVDVTLPGMSGEAVVERLRESRPEMAVVVTSGLAGGPRGGGADGRTSFLQKPFLPARLVEALRAAVDGGAAQGSAAPGGPAEGSPSHGPAAEGAAADGSAAQSSSSSAS